MKIFNNCLFKVGKSQTRISFELIKKSKWIISGFDNFVSAPDLIYPSNLSFVQLNEF